MYFSLKSLQVVDLITDRGTFSKVNFSIPADDFLDDINQFLKEFTIEYTKVVFNLFHKSQEYIAEILTPWGLCFTYNIAFAKNVQNINRTSDDFHYVYANKIFNLKPYVPAMPPKEEDFPVNISTSQNGLWVGFDSDKKDMISLLKNDFDGYVILLHSPFELPTRNSKIFKFDQKFQTRILINPRINSIDETLLDYEPAE